MKKIEALIKADVERMEILSIVQKLDLPDCYVAAGFIRNLVWDHIFSTSTPLNDIDIVFFDTVDKSNRRAEEITAQLNKRFPDFTWQAKNQAFMHCRNHDRPYENTLDAMSFWPEKETAMGVSIDKNGALTFIDAFPLNNIFEGKVTYNPKRNEHVFRQRIVQKQWLKIWPNLQVVI